MRYLATLVVVLLALLLQCVNFDSMAMIDSDNVDLIRIDVPIDWIAPADQIEIERRLRRASKRRVSTSAAVHSIVFY